MAIAEYAGPSRRLKRSRTLEAKNDLVQEYRTQGAQRLYANECARLGITEETAVQAALEQEKEALESRAAHLTARLGEVLLSGKLSVSKTEVE